MSSGDEFPLMKKLKLTEKFELKKEKSKKRSQEYRKRVILKITIFNFSF